MKPEIDSKQVQKPGMLQSQTMIQPPEDSDSEPDVMLVNNPTNENQIEIVIKEEPVEEEEILVLEPQDQNTK